MSDSPWAVIVDGHGAVTERKLVDQKAGSLLKTTVKVISNTVADGQRTVSLTRALKGAGPQYYSFGAPLARDPFCFRCAATLI